MCILLDFLTYRYKVSFVFLIIKPTKCTNFSNLFLEWNSTCFGQFLCPSSGVFHCTHSNGICHTGLLTACEQEHLLLLTSCQQTLWHIPLLCVHRKTPDDGQRNCPKHVEFHSKNKFEKLVHLVGILIRNWTRCTVTWTSNSFCIFILILLLAGRRPYFKAKTYSSYFKKEGFFRWKIVWQNTKYFDSIN